MYVQYFLRVQSTGVMRDAESKPKSGAVVRGAGIAEEKAVLRARMLALRRSIPESLRIDMSMAIAGHVIGLPEIIDAHHIHLYLAICSSAEVDTAAIIDRLSTMGKELVVPVVMDGNLVVAAFQNGDPVVPAQFGQPEPEVVSVVDESLIDVVLIPLLAFDGTGYRLGYGKGLYDSFLHRLSVKGRRVFRIGLAFSRQMVDRVPVDQWDAGLDAVVHENGIIRFI